MFEASFSLGYHACDRVRFSRPFREVASRLFEARAIMLELSIGGRLATLCRAARACPNGSRRSRLEDRIRLVLSSVGPEPVDWDRISWRQSDISTLKKTMILKCPGPGGEKGVLYIFFEDQWVKLFRSGQAAAIADCYDLVLGPTWSPPHDAAILMAAKDWPGRVYTTLNHFDDADTLASLSDKIAPVPLLASSWTNPGLYERYLGQEKYYDVIMLATFSTYKRHWHLFDALRRLPRNLRVLLIGRPIGRRTESALRAEARRFGVEDRFQLWVGPSDEEIRRALCRSRVSLILSRQEGSCVAVAESIMAGTPVGMFLDAHVGSIAFINPQTGFLFDRRRELSLQILEFLECRDHFDPRPWAVKNISCHVSSRILNDALRAGAEEEGRPWTRDIAVMYQNSTPCYADTREEAEHQKAYQDFQDRYGLEIVRPVAEKSRSKDRAR